MKFLLLSFILLSVSTFRGICSPLSWHIEEPEESGSGSGDSIWHDITTTPYEIGSGDTLLQEITSKPSESGSGSGGIPTTPYESGSGDTLWQGITTTPFESGSGDTLWQGITKTPSESGSGSGSGDSLWQGITTTPYESVSGDTLWQGITTTPSEIWSGSGSGDSPLQGITTTPSLTSTNPEPWIHSINVETTITARYVSTTVITEIENQASVSQDSDFRFRLSKGAFISDFFMVIKGRVYQTVLREKEEAQKAYNEAKRQGLTACQVTQSINDLLKFETSVNLLPNTTATIHLSFQEILRRENGVFQHKINIFPKKVVQSFRADVYITEPQGISFANISWEQDDSLNTDFLYDALTVNRESDTKVHAWFNPSDEDQEGLSEIGLQGDLVITYDVERDSGAGHIEVVNGNFVHHISPEGLPITPKNVIFVIDISRSMNDQDGANIYGSKIAHTKLAMASIIDQIREFDHFNIICFSDSITRWNTAVVEATSGNKLAAKQFVNGLRADGDADMHGGLMDAIIRLKELEDQNVRNALSMIILLTDGEPTSGITNPSEIVESITKAIDGKIALLSLAFGASADYKLLQKLSGHNQGLARKIYSDSSPSLQLDGFYKEVATPILHNVDVQYPENAVEIDTLTKTNFISHFEGTEIVNDGKLKDDYEGNELSAFDVQLEWGLTKTTESRLDKGGIDILLEPHQVDDFAQRYWAYVTVKELLAQLQLEIALSEEEENSIRDKATDIALKYKFVTPLTSLYCY